jgi:hypothetical protein
VLLRLDRLIEERGTGMGMPVLGSPGCCPRTRTVSINDRCGVNFPQLPELFMQAGLTP